MPSRVRAYLCAAAVIDNRELLSPACIAVHNGVITGIAKEPHPQAEVIDLGETLLLPGFVNAHCHLELTKLGPLSEKNFIPWLKKLVKEKLKLSEQDVTVGVKQGAQELMDSGATTVFDHVSFDSPLAAYKGLPITVVGFGEVLGVAPEKAEKIYAAQNKRRLAVSFPYHVSPHAIHSLHPKILNKVFREQQRPFSIHIAESRDESLYFKDGTGSFLTWMPGQKRLHDAQSAVSTINALGQDFEKTLIVHANFVTPTDIALIKKTNACVVHCPGSFHFFEHDHFPHDEFKRMGVPIALGTDSLCSNASLNMLAEARMFLKDHPQTDFFELLNMLTVNAAGAIGFYDIGKISVGYRADMIGFPRTADLIGLFDNKNVKLVIKDGELRE